MTTADAPTWFAGTARGTTTSHLLDLDPEAAIQRMRPALCGQRHRTWRPVDQMPGPSRYVRCSSCMHTAGPLLGMPVADPVRIAPRAPRNPGGNQVPPTGSLTPEENTQAGRTLRRIAFRDSLPKSRHAQTWRPQPYRNRPIGLTSWTDY